MTSSSESQPEKPGPEARRDGFTTGLLWLLLFLLPLTLYHYWVPYRGPVHRLFFWLAVLVPALLLLAEVWRRRRATRHEGAHVGSPAEEESGSLAAMLTQYEGQVGDLFTASAGRLVGDRVILEGRLRVEPAVAVAELDRRFDPGIRRVYLLEGEGDRVALVIEPRREGGEIPPPSRRSGIGWNVLLLALTVVTTTWAGASHRGLDMFRQPFHFWAGLSFSVPLLLILGVHELGHYFVARRRGVDASLPYFIPVPFGLGTFGAIIRIRSVFPDRRAAFDVGIAGPLAGLAVALPALIFGLQTSELVPASAGIGTQVTSSVLLGWIASWLATGDLTAADAIVFSPLAFAGWLGLLVTALNLLPVGQLDGGHIAYGLLGRRRAQQVGVVALLLLVLLGIFYWSGWLVWAFIAFFVTGFQHDPARDEVSGLSFGRRALGVAALALLVLIMAPVPHRFMQPLGIACPYL
jgi:hypothetical protein